MSNIPTSRLILEFYDDKELTKRVFEIKSDVPTNAGASQTWIVFVKNAIRDELKNISFYADDKEINFNPKTIEYLLPSEFAPIKITWGPDVNRRKALKCSLFANCQVIIKP